MDNILQFKKDVETYKELSQKYSEDGKKIQSLGCLFSALKQEPFNAEILSLIADEYSDMDNIELSNKFWYLYLNNVPENKKSVAYQELGINYFCLGNFWLSGYYFNLKYNKDGFMNADDFDDDIKEFLSGVLERKDAYHIAYPFDRADYSYELKRAKRAFAVGNYAGAVTLYEKVPKECLDVNSLGELALSYYMCKEGEKGIEISKYSLLKHGESLTAYSNMASLYKALKDEEKSKYYYDKALSVKKYDADDMDEEYKLFTCAMDFNDDETVVRCLDEIIKEREYDPLIWFFNGVANANLNNVKEALESFKTAYRICPFDQTYKFYAEYFEKLSKDNEDKDKILPLKYDKKLPESVIKSYKKFLSDCDEQNANVLMKNPKNREAFKWGVKYGKDDIAKKCATALVFSGLKTGENIVLDILLDPDVQDERKRLLIYALILAGKKEKFGVVANKIFVKVKPRKLLFEDDVLYEVFISAYAYAMSKAVFWGVEDLDKIGFAINKLYKKHGKELIRGGFNTEEIAAIAVYYCRKDGIKGFKDVCNALCVDKKRIETLTPFIKGEEDD